MGMHVVLAGSPMAGFVVYGPFKTEEDAKNWVAEFLDRQEMSCYAWAVALNEPMAVEQMRVVD